eukprot:TRINITY_DN23510_c0_g1_i2.p1 TRINITY_DN23510_c0_g1~~TRINITY_DN23510_c0_g1_i2.p1  ORF type:complete len:192 (-),score=16.28 TRINITY_DN23510_c0_g1_i2:24-599(-)
MSACAVCDGPAPIFRNKALAVIGGGDSAAEEATFLTKYASKVYLVHRRDQLRASKVMAQRVLKNPKIEVLWNKVPVEVKGDGQLLGAMVLQDTKSGQRSEVEVNEFFYAIGHDPNTGIITTATLPSSVHISDLVHSDKYMIVEPGSSKTRIPGLFAAGDVHDKRYRQAVTAAGSGCMAALDCEKFLEEHDL